MSTLTTRPTAVQPPVWHEPTVTREEWKTLGDLNVLGVEMEPLPPHPEEKVGHVMQYDWIYRSSALDKDDWEDLREALFAAACNLGFELCATFRGDKMLLIGINHPGHLVPIREHRDSFVKVTEGQVGDDTITWKLVGEPEWHCIPKCRACRCI